MTDVRLFHTADGGNIEFAGDDALVGDVKLDTGLETAVYLSWFGGNERDAGIVDDDDDPDHQHRYIWWGNIGEPEERHMVSETQHLLRALPATSNNLLRIEGAMLRDIEWGLDDGTFTDATVTASLIGKDRIRLAALIVVRGEEFAVAFETSWGD